MKVRPCSVCGETDPKKYRPSWLKSHRQHDNWKCAACLRADWAVRAAEKKEREQGAEKRIAMLAELEQERKQALCSGRGVERVRARYREVGLVATAHDLEVLG